MHLNPGKCGALKQTDTIRDNHIASLKKTANSNIKQIHQYSRINFTAHANSIVNNLTIQNEIALMYLLDFATYHYEDTIANITKSKRQHFHHTLLPIALDIHNKKKTPIFAKNNTKIVLTQRSINVIKNKSADDIHIFYILSPMHGDPDDAKKRFKNVVDAIKIDPNIKYFNALYWSDWSIIKVTFYIYLFVIKLFARIKAFSKSKV